MTRVRFAPSPTGILHVGGIRTALLNYFFAKSKKGEFILRNEDTDQARKVEGSLEATLSSLEWLGVSWDDLVVQSERLSYYKKYADTLVTKGMAREDDGAIRFITLKEGTTSWTDAIGNKEISFENKNIEDFIILKKDGFPTYHLANVVDDHLMEITHVIRGEDWIPSAPKHIMLYDAFGWDRPTFAHVPNVLGLDGKKLSKRRGAKSVLDFKSDGYLPQALLNYLMLLGWSPKDDRDILTKEEISSEFLLENVNSAPAIFDEKKLLWMNGEYIRMASLDQVVKYLEDYDSGFVENLRNLNLLGFIEVAQTRVKTLKEFRISIEQMMGSNVSNIKDESLSLRKNLFDKFSALASWDKQAILDMLMTDFIKKGIKFPLIYEAIYGVDRGLPLADTFELLGRDKTLALLK
jgi:glutamyl-tRNA synthetase